jgi:hypothetical protein
MATFMMHSPAFVIIFRRLLQNSKIVNTGSKNPPNDENGFHGSLRYRMGSEITETHTHNSLPRRKPLAGFGLGSSQIVNLRYQN